MPKPIAEGGRLLVQCKLPSIRRTSE